MDELPFSKRKQTQSYMTAEEYRGAKKENHLQVACEEYLSLKNIKYIHIPNCVYHLIFGTNYLSKRLKQRARRLLSGVPDLLIFLPEGKFGRVLLIELKSKKGQARTSQKRWARSMNVYLVKSFEGFQKILNEFIKETGAGE